MLSIEEILIFYLQPNNSATHFDMRTIGIYILKKNTGIINDKYKIKVYK